MKRTTYSIMAAALLTAGALLTTACSNEDDAAIENATPSVGSETIQFTATLAPKGDDGTTTRAITTGKDGENKEILNVVWAENEQIAVRYQTGATTYATTTATVTAVDPTTGTATISAALTSPMDGGTVKFVYPASLVNAAGDDIDENKLLNQHGNLTGANGISTLYDAATGSGTISVSAGTAVVSSKVTLTNRVCIGKFHFTLDKGGELVQQAFNNLKIYDGNGHVYTITSDRPDEKVGGLTRSFTNTDDIYVALLPVSGMPVIFHYEQTVVGGKVNYIKYSPNTTLVAGKFYRSLNLTLTKDDYNGVYTFKDLSAGSITAVNGDYIYQSNSTATANTITIPDGATVTLEDVNINTSASAGITCNGTNTIILKGTNRVVAEPNYNTQSDNYPAIQVGSGSMTITGDGSLTATGGRYAAAIGCGYNGTCGDIIINDGSVNAVGGIWAAGIGGGYQGRYGSINIGSGITSVIATLGYQAEAPIGKGKDDTGSGSVTIDGTTSWTAGTATTNLTFEVSTVEDIYNYSVTRWTLTHK